MKGIHELRAKQDERANERISAWLRDVVCADNEGTTWELRMEALALLGQSIVRARRGVHCATVAHTNTI